MEVQQDAPNGPENQSPENMPTPTGIPSQQQTGAPLFQIDPRFQSLPMEEAIARTHQSIVTPLYMKIKELEDRTNRFDSYAENLALIVDNPDAQVAFIREFAPQFVPKMDIDDQVKAELDRQFGADFKFDPDEAKNDHWSTSAKYQRKMNNLYNEIEAKQKGSNSKTFAEIKKEVVARKTQSNENVNKQLEELKLSGVPDEEIKTFMQWAPKASLKDLHAHWRAMNNFTNGPNLTSMQGGPITPNDIYNKADLLFGRAKS